MGFIEHNKALCMLFCSNQYPHAAGGAKHGARLFLFISACVYNADKQKTFVAPSLKEEDAILLCGGRIRLGKIVF